MTRIWNRDEDLDKIIDWVDYSSGRTIRSWALKPGAPEDVAAAFDDYIAWMLEIHPTGIKDDPNYRRRVV